MSDQFEADFGLDYLLDLHGVIQIHSDEGHWVKFEAIRVPPSLSRPHGIKYSLTLHRLDGERLLGFDNAHPMADSNLAYDHWHRCSTGRIVPYHFTTCYQLLQDFFTEVDRILKKESR